MYCKNVRIKPIIDVLLVPAELRGSGLDFSTSVVYYRGSLCGHGLWVRKGAEIRIR